MSDTAIIFNTQCQQGIITDIIPQVIELMGRFNTYSALNGEITGASRSLIINLIFVEEQTIDGVTLESGLTKKNNEDTFVATVSKKSNGSTFTAQLSIGTNHHLVTIKKKNKTIWELRNGVLRNAQQEEVEGSTEFIHLLRAIFTPNNN